MVDIKSSALHNIVLYCAHALLWSALACSSSFSHNNTTPQFYFIINGFDGPLT